MVLRMLFYSEKYRRAYLIPMSAAVRADLLHLVSVTIIDLYIVKRATETRTVDDYVSIIVIKLLRIFIRSSEPQGVNIF